MSHPRHDLPRILDLAREMVRPDVSARALAASCGPVKDPLGRGAQLDVDPPGITGVHSMTVLPERGGGTPPAPGDVMFSFAVGNRPRLTEVRTVFGEGEEVDPLDWEPSRVVFKGPASEYASVLVIADVDDVPGTDGELRVSHIALRRDARTIGRRSG
jgi:hypothetical protein